MGLPPKTCLEPSEVDWVTFCGAVDSEETACNGLLTTGAMDFEFVAFSDVVLSARDLLRDFLLLMTFFEFLVGCPCIVLVDCEMDSVSFITKVSSVTLWDGG